jgi:ABC-2 type transport system permease protein
MHKVWLVVKREYVTRVRTKAFVISTILVPALLAGFIAFELAIARGRGLGTLHIVIVDEAGGIAGVVSRSLAADKLPSGEPAYAVEETMESRDASTAAQARFSTEVRTGSLDGYLWIPRDVLSGGDVRFVTRSATIFTQMSTIDGAVKNAVLLKRFQERGIGVRDVKQLLRDVNVQVIRVTSHGQSREKGQAFVIAYIMAFALYILIIVYGARTMRSVMEEKTTRVMEVLLSSVRPAQLLAGKIVGVAAAGLTQLGIWAACAGILGAYGLTMARAFSPGLSNFHIQLPEALLIYMLLYFVGGYLLYASLYAAIGAAVSAEQDAQQLSMPVTMLLVASVILITILIQNPNSTPSVILSIIPFFAPVMMIMRIALGAAPTWQIALSLAVLALTVAGAVFVSARIYRVGVLMYGKRPSLVELARWFRYS